MHLRDVQGVHGRTATTIVTHGWGVSCGYAFTVGQRYFHRRLGPARRRALDVALFEDRAARRFDDNDRRPVATLQVTLVGPVTRQALTKRDGTFSFDGLPAGTYRLRFTPPSRLTLVAPTEDVMALPNAYACVDRRILFERPRR